MLLSVVGCVLIAFAQDSSRSPVFNVGPDTNPTLRSKDSQFHS